MCMKIKIHTLVGQPLKVVKEGFTGDLFLKLNPPFPKVKLLKFDGCLTGDIVSLELNFIFFRQTWTSEIIEDQSTDKAFYFIDQGTELPFFFRYWQHKHLLSDQRGSTVITDDITYKTPFIILDWLMYPLLYWQFKQRSPVYRKVFASQ